MNENMCVIFPQPGKVELIEEDIVKPAAREITVEATVSLISTGTEMFCLSGKFDPDTHWAQYVTYPFSPGYSMVGRVVAVGEAVTEYKVGDRIFCNTSHSKFVNIDVDSEYVFFRLPYDVSDDDAAWSMLAFITQTAVRRAEHAMGDTAAVIGAGPLGQLIVQYLKTIGLGEIMVIDPVQSRLDLASKLGATRCFAGFATDAWDFVAEHTDGCLADVVYDVTGHYSVLPDALKLPRRFGALILVGDCPTPSLQHLTHDVITRQLRIIGSHNFSLPPQYAHWTPAKQALLFMEYIRRGTFDVRCLVSHRIKPEQLPVTYENLKKNRSQTLGILVDW